MAVDCEPGPDQRPLQRAARAFARDVLGDVADAIADLGTPEERFDALRPFYASAINTGFLRTLIDPAGPSLVGAALVAEELAAVDVNVSATLVATLQAAAPILAAGTPAQAARMLGPLWMARGAPLAAFEDVDVERAGLQTVLVRDGDDWILRGWQHHTANGYGWRGQGADLYVVACRPDATPEALTVVVVPGRAPGLHITGSRDTAGQRAAVAPRIHFDEVPVPAADVLGVPGHGAGILARASAAGAALVGALAAGVARAAFDRALAHARATGDLDDQAVGFLLADVKGRIEAIRTLTWRACAAVEHEGEGAAELAVASKVFASETAVQAVWDAMRVVGADAYSNHLPLNGLLADVVGFPLLHGSNLGVRRRHLHALLRRDDYDGLASLDAGIPNLPPAAVAV
jgi:nitroalkane oxidase